MNKLNLILVSLILLASCRKTLDAPVPDTSWALFNSSSAQRLTNQTRQSMQGVYNVLEGADKFGSLVALKWSFVIEGTDITYHLSVFTGKDIAYFTMEGR